MRLVVGASAGGHVNELLILLAAARGRWPVSPCAYVTTMGIAVPSLAAGDLPVLVLGEADRTKPLGAVRVMWRAFKAAAVLRPDIVVTTGSGPLAMFCLWARIFGARIVWIDSVAQVDRMSLSGRIVRPFAGLCLVQWADVAARYPGTEYAGELF
jgi:exopolysaccharide biosynthesis glucuronosyltransferase PssD